MSVIKKAAELTIPTTIKMMVYGDPGAGKTTLALSSPKPLLLDFDNGVKRVNLGHLDGVDIVQVGAWTDIQQLVREDLSAYETIVVDTVQKLIDFIITYKCGGNQPKIQDWGRINQEFLWFTRTLSAMNKHIVFVAHSDIRKDGEDLVHVPMVRDSNYKVVITELDLLGFLEMRSVNGQQVRSITFDPTNRNSGKNTCNLPSVMLVTNSIGQDGELLKDNKGNIRVPNNFLSEKVIKPYFDMMSKKQELGKKYEELVSQITSDIEQITDAKSANYYKDHMNDYEHIGSSVAKMRSLFGAKVNTLKLRWEKDHYEDAV